MGTGLCGCGASCLRGYSATSLRFVVHGPYTLTNFGGTTDDIPARPLRRRIGRCGEPGHMGNVLWATMASGIRSGSATSLRSAEPPPLDRCQLWWHPPMTCRRDILRRRIGRRGESGHMCNVLGATGASGLRSSSATSLRFVEPSPWPSTTLGGAAATICR